MSQHPFTGIEILCPLCKSDDQSGVGTLDRHGEPLRTVLCRSCGHVFTNPQPTTSELQEFYGEKYRLTYKGTGTPKQKHVYRAGLRALERLEQLQNHLPKGSHVLDIGSGGGEFVYLLNRAGYTARGQEPNQGYAAFSRTEYGVDIREGSLEDMPLSDEQWHGITLHHVLEHLADPVDALSRLRPMLKTSGKLIVEVPNVEARFHGPSRLFHFAHLHVFSHDGLGAAVSQAGFSVKSLVLQPHTRHINVVLSVRDDQTAAEPEHSCAETAERIETALRTYTTWADAFSARPYRRLWANLKRPIIERLALAKLGQPHHAKDILDRLYDGYTQKTAVN